jgi:flagellar motor switch protein FliN
MSEMLSQEEIDALLNAGIGGIQEEEEEEPPRPSPPRMSSTLSSPSISTPQMQSFDQPQDRKVSLRPSAKINSPVNVQIAEFTSFDSDIEPEDTTNLEIILNLDLEVRVELGKTQKTVKEILELGSGSVIELKKLNGEPVDLLVNKKHFSKGEMIVIGENFGVRVTDILSIVEIIEALK